MGTLLYLEPKRVETVVRGTYWDEHLREPRVGIMLHYDGGPHDAYSLRWLQHPECDLGYQYLVLRDGRWASMAPMDSRAYHAGICRSSDGRLEYVDANSAFYGIAISATDGEQATAEQVMTVSNICAGLFVRHGWSFQMDRWRVTGHDAEAWPRGRKIDPTGSNPESPVLDVEKVKSVLRQVVNSNPDAVR